MTPLVLDGKALSRQIETELTHRVRKIREASGKVPALATILVGDDPASEIYVNMKGNACNRIGVNSKKIHLPKETTTGQLLQVIDGLNNDADIFGILLQHPVPSQINERACFDRIALTKDVDGVTALGFGSMSLGENVFKCATPGGIMTLLEHYRIDLSGKHAVIVGRSPILGKPMAMMLLNANATITICHSRTKGLSDLIGAADLVVGAVGKPEFIKAEWIKDGAVIIDAGYHKGGIGDIEIDKAKAKCSAYTPVPGGVGPMTIATLISQTVTAAEKILLPDVDVKQSRRQE
jgi:methylenetetrahydrofolate dehydrogenase (NADP+)/methenyltetrahydrofolate cyclohydrolase